MMGIRLDINGKEIEYYGVRNTERKTKSDGKTLYDYEITLLRRNGKVMGIPLARIWHCRDDGACVLAEKALSIVNETRAKNATMPPFGK